MRLLLRLIVVLAALPVVPAHATDNISYHYDALGRLTSSDSRRAGGSGFRDDFFLDKAGNRTGAAASGPYKPVAIGANTTLHKNESVLSNDTRFRFVFQYDGNLVLYDQNGNGIWATMTFPGGNAHVDMQSDGNLVMYDANGNALWSSGTSGYPGAQLRVQDDGNAVIYDAYGNPRWSTSTCCR